MSEDEFGLGDLDDLLGDSFDNLDDMISGDTTTIELTEILLISGSEIYTEIMNKLPPDTYNVFYSENEKNAIPILMQEKIAITLIESEKIEDISSLTSLIHQYVPLTRIVLITPVIKVSELSSILRKGSINALLPLPLTQNSMMGVLAKQEATHSINKMLVSMITEPPKLTKASFLLLDPTIQFGSELEPVNFVGIMIISQTIPKYTRFFEKTLAQDEFLTAGFLTGVSSLGNSLFESDEALKEINFGGISVIFQFHGDIQLFFFVRNLTRDNYANAEQRVIDFSNTIVNNFYDDFQNAFMTDAVLDKIDLLADEFNKMDEEEEEKFTKLIDQQITLKEDSSVIIYSKQAGENILKRILSAKDEITEDTYKIMADIISDEKLIIDKVREYNHYVIIIDSDCHTGDRSKSDFLDFLKEMLPSLQVIYLERDQNFNDTIVESFNSDTINYLLSFDADEKLLYEVFAKAIQKAKEIIKKSSADAKSSSESTTDMDAMKILLRKEQESYAISELPELKGIIIAEDMQVVFEEYWDNSLNVDAEMIIGMIAGVAGLSQEMFVEKEDVKLLELAGNNVFVSRISNYIFCFFVVNISPATMAIINKEIDAVSAVYFDIMVEAAGMFTFAQLNPIFSKLANETRAGFTDLLRESRRLKKKNEGN